LFLTGRDGQAKGEGFIGGTNPRPIQLNAENGIKGASLRYDRVVMQFPADANTEGKEFRVSLNDGDNPMNGEGKAKCNQDSCIIRVLVDYQNFRLANAPTQVTDIQIIVLHIGDETLITGYEQKHNNSDIGNASENRLDFEF